MQGTGEHTERLPILATAGGDTDRREGYQSLWQSGSREEPQSAEPMVTEPHLVRPQWWPARSPNPAADGWALGSRADGLCEVVQFHESVGWGWSGMFITAAGTWTWR